LHGTVNTLSSPTVLPVPLSERIYQHSIGQHNRM
jgi:hypothetical protein